MVCVHVQTAILTSKGYYPVALLKQGTPIIIYEDGEFRSIPLEFSLGKHGFHRTRLNQEDEVKWNGNWIPGGGFSQWTTLPVGCAIHTKQGPVPLIDKPRNMPIFDIRMLDIQQTHNLDYLNEEHSKERIRENVKRSVKAKYTTYEVQKLSRIYESDKYKYRRGRIRVMDVNEPTILPCVKIKAPNVIISNLIIIGESNED